MNTAPKLPMTQQEIEQWIDRCNHEPARQVLRDYLRLALAPPSGEGVGGWHELASEAVYVGLCIGVDCAGKLAELQESGIYKPRCEDGKPSNANARRDADKIADIYRRGLAKLRAADKLWPKYTTPQSAPEDGEQSFIDEWESRFGFLATHNNPRSIESIDEVACLLITPPPASQERGGGGCICRGNWRLIVKETQPFMGEQFNNVDGVPHTFFGVVWAEDDFYYGMWNRLEKSLALLSCVGSIESHGYTPVITTARGMLASDEEIHAAQALSLRGRITSSTEAAAVAHHGTGENPHHSEPVPNGLEIQSASTYSDGDAFNRTLCASPPSSAAEDVTTGGTSTSDDELPGMWSPSDLTGGATDAAEQASSAAGEVLMTAREIREANAAGAGIELITEAEEQRRAVEQAKPEASINSCLTYSKPAEQAQVGELQEEIQWALNGLPQLAINLRFEGQTSRADTVERIIVILRRLAGGVTVDDAMRERFKVAFHSRPNETRTYDEALHDALVAALGAK